MGQCGDMGFLRLADACQRLFQFGFGRGHRTSGSLRARPMALGCVPDFRGTLNRIG
jgi:hypothetical protein